MNQPSKPDKPANHPDKPANHPDKPANHPKPDKPDNHPHKPDNHPKPDKPANHPNKPDKPIHPLDHLQGLAEHLSKKTHQVNELFQALQALSSIPHGQGSLNDIISALAKVQQNKKKAPASNPPPKKDSPLTGDQFHDLFNSPAIHNIIKEVMKNRRHR